MRTYSDFFKTLHDETGPTGYLGRGTHYSVLRAIVFHDPMGKSLPEGQFAEFAVIWDEDHDARVMEPIEQIYGQGLLSSFLMFGERQGSFTAVLSNKVTSAIEEISFDPKFLRRVDELQFSLRTANCCKNDDIVYVGDLVRKTEGELLRTPNFGRRCFYEVKEALAQMGLNLGTEVPGWTEYMKDITKDNERVGFLETKINEICQSLNDPWPSKVVALGSEGNPIIGDDDKKVSLYLKNLNMLWQLGT